MPFNTAEFPLSETLKKIGISRIIKEGPTIVIHNSHSRPLRIPIKTDWNQTLGKLRSEARRSYGFTDDNLAQLVDCVSKNHLSTLEDSGSELAHPTGKYEELLADSEYSEADKRGVLVREIQTSFTLKTLADTGEILYYDNGIYRQGGEGKIASELHALGGYEITNSRRNEVLATIRAITSVDRSEFDTDVNILNLKNGLLNTGTGEFKPHDKAYLSRVQLPIFYRRGVTCPQNMKFFTEILEVKHLGIIVRLLGYCLYRTARYEKAFMLNGEGSNGKSTFIKVLCALLGEDNVSNVSLQELNSDRFAAAEIEGKLLNALADLKADRVKDTGNFKMLVSGDRLRGQRKYQQPYNFKPFAKLVYSANKIPETDDDSYAYYRRWIVIPFNRTFEGGNNNTNLIDKLTTESELSGLLNVALVGLKKLKEDGGFTGADDVEEIRKQYLVGASKIADFIAQKCITLDDPGTDGKELKVKTATLQNEFWTFCKATGCSYIDSHKFGEELRKRGIERKDKRVKGERAYYYVGIALKATDSGVAGQLC